MKAIKYLLTFIIFVIISDQILSSIINYIYKDTYTGQSGGKINYLLKHFENVSVLAVGNSRCAHHIIPKELSNNAYNLSHNGMSLIFHTGIINQIVRNEKIKIDTILLHLEMHEIFSVKKLSSSDIQHLKYYYDKNLWIKNEITKLSRFEQLKYLFSSYKWNGKIMSVINNRIKSEFNEAPKRGYVPTMPTERDSINVTWDFKRTMNSKKRIKNKVINTEFKKYIQQIKELCKSQGITLICFTSPIYKPLKESIIINGELNNYFNSIGVPYFNYFNEFNNDIKLQSIKNWKDVYHMNQKGALVFTRILKREFNKTSNN